VGGVCGSGGWRGSVVMGKAEGVFRGDLGAAKEGGVFGG
jgi:hypothetical protein